MWKKSVIKVFNDPIAAIEEASFLAAQENRPYAVVDIGNERLKVVPLVECLFEKYPILEVCRP